MSLLEVTGLNSYYGDSHILFDVALRVEKNEVVALLGRNGAGKTTTLKSLMGMVRPRAGSDPSRRRGAARARPRTGSRAPGMQLVPEERRMFGSLNVEENIVLARLTAPKPGRSRASTRSSPASPSAAAAAGPTFPAASSRCWRSPARWCAIRRSSCSTSRSRVSRRSSCGT